MFARQEFPLFPVPRGAPADRDVGSVAPPAGPAGGDGTTDVERPPSASGRRLDSRDVRPGTRRGGPQPPGSSPTPVRPAAGRPDTTPPHPQRKETGVTVPEAATTDTPTGPAAAAWTAEQVSGELRDAWLLLATASVLLERTSEGSMHPELRRARRCGEEALDLASSVEQLIGGGLAQLRDQIGGGDVTSIGRVVGSLNVSRSQFAEAAERITALPQRLRAAEQQLHDATGPELDVAEVTRDWARAIEHLGLLADSVTEAAGALGSYADRVLGRSS